MQIPLRKNYEQLEKIRISESELRNIVKQIITEELGSFDNQVDVGEFCAEKAIDMLKQKKEEKHF